MIQNERDTAKDFLIKLTFRVNSLYTQEAWAQIGPVLEVVQATNGQKS